MRTIVGSRGEFKGWQVRLCWHTGISDGIVSTGKNSKNELEELSVTLLRALTTVLIHCQAHTLSQTFKDTVSHANNGVRDTLHSPMSVSDSHEVLILPFAKWMLSPLTTSRVVNKLMCKEITFTPEIQENNLLKSVVGLIKTQGYVHMAVKD